MPTNPNLEPALSYAANGWPVFPVKRTKAPLTEHGHNDATTDAEQITAWFTTLASAQIGLKCDGFSVLDVDGPTGQATLDALTAEHGPLPETFAVRTGSGGTHYYFSDPDSLWPNQAGQLGPGLDTRASGKGYVVAPPSRNAKGAYSVLCFAPLADTPPWLMARLNATKPATPAPTAPPPPPEPAIPATAQRYVAAAIHAECSKVAAATEGTRNHTLNIAACSLGSLTPHLLDPDAATEALLQSALACGLPDKEARQTIRSGLTAGARTPRQLTGAPPPPPPAAAVDAPTPQAPARPIVMLPGGAIHVTMSTSAEQMGDVLGKALTVFVRSGSLISFDPRDGHIAAYDSNKLITDIEAHARVQTTVADRSGGFQTVTRNLKPSDARAICASSAFANRLPQLSLKTKCPVLIASGAELRTIQGYDRDTGIYAGGDPVPEVPIEDAVQALAGLWSDYEFVNAGDRARAMAAMITPAMVQGDLLQGGRAPIDLGEANQSQSGKSYRAKVLAAIYRDVPRSVTQKSGVGSIEDSFSAALIDGANFIMFDNMVGKFQSPALDSALTEPWFTARAAYRPETGIDMRRVNIAMTSNSAQLSTDLTNRCNPVSIRKRPGTTWRVFPEGDLLRHVQANQPYYLGCVFSVIRAWHAAGMPRTTETRHDNQAWATRLDWIVQSLFQTAPLCDGLQEVKARISKPEIAWLRQVCIQIEAQGQLGHWLAPIQLAEAAYRAEIEVPGLPKDMLWDQIDDSQNQGIKSGVAIHTGRRLSRCKTNPKDDVFTCDSYTLDYNRDAARNCSLYRITRTGVPLAPPPPDPTQTHEQATTTAQEALPF